MAGSDHPCRACAVDRLAQRGAGVVPRSPAQLAARLAGVHQDGLAHHVDPPRLGGDERRPRHDLGERIERRPRDRDRAPAERAGDVADGDRRIAPRGCRCPARPRPTTAARIAVRDVVVVHELERRTGVGEHGPDQRGGVERPPQLPHPRAEDRLTGEALDSVGASRPATMQGRNT